MTITSRNTTKLVGVLALVLGGCLNGSSAAAQERIVDFAREVRPILSQNCFTCHGPADDRRRRDLRLDTPEGFFADRPEFGGPVIVAGNADESLLYQRITAEVERDRMPRNREALTDDEIETRQDEGTTTGS